MTDIDFMPALASLQVELDKMGCAFSRVRFYYFVEQRALYAELPWNDRMLFTEEHGWKRAERAKFNEPERSGRAADGVMTYTIKNESQRMATRPVSFSMIDGVRGDPDDVAAYSEALRRVVAQSDAEDADVVSMTGTIPHADVLYVCHLCGSDLSENLKLSMDQPWVCSGCEALKQGRPSTPNDNALRTALARARKARLPATLTQDEWKATVGHFADRCALCDGPWSMVDFATPVALGGGATMANCYPSCIRCNVEKGNHEFENVGSWRQSSGRDYMNTLEWLWSHGRQSKRTR